MMYHSKYAHWVSKQPHPEGEKVIKLIKAFGALLKGFSAAWHQRHQQRRRRGNVDIRELLAAYAHEAWALYMQHFFSQCIQDGFCGPILVPKAYVVALRRLIATPYTELSEEEKNGDRAEADKVLAIFSGLREEVTDV